MSNRTLKVTPETLDAFITELADGASITAACRQAKVGRATVYEIRQRDEAFALRWADAIEEGTDALEDVLMRRARDGVSDQAAMFLLKARRPERYRERVSVDQTTRVAPPSAQERRVVQAAAERDPEAFARMSRALLDVEEGGANSAAPHS